MDPFHVPLRSAALKQKLTIAMIATIKTNLT
jgi:hypothetical protein